MCDCDKDKVACCEAGMTICSDLEVIKFQLLRDLYDRGMVSKKTVLKAFGLDYNKEKAQIKNEELGL